MPFGNKTEFSSWLKKGLQKYCISWTKCIKKYYKSPQTWAKCPQAMELHCLVFVCTVIWIKCELKMLKALPQSCILRIISIYFTLEIHLIFNQFHDITFLGQQCQSKVTLFLCILMLIRVNYFFKIHKYVYKFICGL